MGPYDFYQWPRQSSEGASERPAEASPMPASTVNESVTLYCALVGPDRCLRWVDPSCRELGHSPETWIGQHLEDLLGEDLYGRALAQFDRAFAGEAAQCEVRGTAPGSLKEIDLHISLYPGHHLEDGRSGVLMVALDTTEQRGLQRKLYSSESHIEAIFDSTLDGIVAIDQRGAIVAVNSAIERLFDYRAAELVGQNVSILMPSPYAEEHDSYIQRYQETGETHIIGSGRELTGLRRDGNEFPIHLSVTEVDHLGCFTGVIRDLTEAKENEKRMRRNERLAGMGKVMACLVHESRNALARTRANLRRLARRVKEDSELTELVEAAMAAEGDLHQLFEEIRDYAAPIIPERRPHSIAELVEQAWSSLELKRQGHDAEIALSGEFPVCMLDENLWVQAFRNLLENALQACPDPLRVEVSVSEGRLNKRRAVRVSVRDNGPGIEAEQRERVLEPFFTTRTKGTGLGLAIVENIVEAHEGRFTVGNPEKGAEFVIVLPCPEAAV